MSATLALYRQLLREGAGFSSYSIKFVNGEAVSAPRCCCCARSRLAC